jgi:hypothetical protein
MTKMSKEVLKVEFEVESTVDRDSGFQEKLLKFRGSDTRYKGIVKDNQLVAILGRNYKLITNNTVKNAVHQISIINGYHGGFTEEGWKMFVHAWHPNGKDGVLVANSVDGTLALRCFAIQNIAGHTGVLVTNKIQNVMRRHTKKAVSTQEGLAEEIEAVMVESQRYGNWLNKMQNIPVKVALDTLVLLLDKLPKEYTKVLRNMIDFKTFSEPTVKDVYESIAKKIWASDTKMVTKLQYYRELNDVVFIVVGI